MYFTYTETMIVHLLLYIIISVCDRGHWSTNIISTVYNRARGLL